MREGSPSLTAQRVAAYRLGFVRVPTPFGDPSADERLALDIAGSLEFTPSERMARYLQGRTAFFDRVVVSALERGVTQVAAVGAGYDGRPWRYAKPGVRWFEVDHPATQADKRRRTERLQIDVSHVSFVGIDLTGGGLDSALVQSGWDPDAQSLMLCEGVAVYLDAPVLNALLTDLRALATAGTRLALSLSIQITDPDERAQHARFQAAVAALGEPARNALTSEDAGRMLAGARWRAVDISERSRQAGFAVAAPVWEPAGIDAPVTASRVGKYLEQLYHRHGIDGLPHHLGDAYGIVVSGIRQLDVGVFRVERRGRPDWVARVLPSARPILATRGDAEILGLLEQVGFPAERCADPEPVTTYQGQAVLVTEYLAGAAAKRSTTDFELLGDLLGRLHALRQLPAAAARPGGAWHHLVFQGGPADEIAATMALLDAAAARIPAWQRTLYQTLRQALSEAESCEHLPESLIHPDFVPANAINTSDGATTLVDWTGAGQGPRLWSLAFLLWAAWAHRLSPVASVMSAYRQHVHLEAVELDRLAGAIATRPLIFGCWSFATGREQLAEVAERLPTIRARAERIAAQASIAVSRSRRPR